ncbi:MAG: hypothetical protein NTV33_04240 [Coprothermobacterota bacterium]|nr:hypothetical protein [Coprothermobacterota bacterium]
MAFLGLLPGTGSVGAGSCNKTSGIIGFPGTAAPQCGICSDKGENNRTGEQSLRRLCSRGYLPHFDTEQPAGSYSARNSLPGAIQLGTACGSMSQNTLPGVIELPGLSS